MDKSTVTDSPATAGPPPVSTVAPSKKPRKRRKLLFYSIGALVVVILLLATVFRPKTPIITVQTEKVARRSITELVVANGRIYPVKQVVISPEVAGEIVALPVKEGDQVKKGDLLVQIKPDNYIASRNSAEAMYKSATGSRSLAQAELDKAESEFKRSQELFQHRLVSDSIFTEVKTAYEVAKLRYQNAIYQEEQSRFGLDKAKDDLSKATILSPMDGTVTRLNSQAGERVLGTSFNKGTEILTVSDLSEMEARVDIGEMDVVLIAAGQNARLEVDAFKDRKFNGLVTHIANSAKGLGQPAAGGMGGGGGGGGGGQEATRFEVHIRVNDREQFRPGMSVTAEIETRLRTNVLSVPFASVTARAAKNDQPGQGSTTNSAPAGDAGLTNVTSVGETNTVKNDKRPAQITVVFVVDGDHVKMMPVKIGISDDTHWEITEGLQENQEIVSGGHAAISRLLQDGKKIKKGTVTETKEAM